MLPQGTSGTRLHLSQGKTTRVWEKARDMNGSVSPRPTTLAWRLVWSNCSIRIGFVKVSCSKTNIFFVYPRRQSIELSGEII